LRNHPPARAILFLSILAVFAVTSSRAVEPTKEEGVVWRNQIFDGYVYRENFLPPQTRDFWILADSANAVSTEQTFIYFWPLSREYYASFETFDKAIDGELEVSQGGKIIRKLGRQQYVIVYPNGVTGPGAYLALGKRAATEQSKYRAAMREYMNHPVRERSAPGVPNTDSDASSHDELKLYVSDVQSGFVLDLPPGTFDVRLTRDGLVVEGTEHFVHAVLPPAAKAVTWDIVPEERWTHALPTDTVRNYLYSTPGKTFFAIPSRSDLFDDAVYQHLLDPQTLGQDGAVRWVRRSVIEDAVLETSLDGQTWRSAHWSNFTVQQTGGADLGYTVEPTARGGRVDLRAFKISLPEFSAATQLLMRVRSSKTGQVYEDSLRVVRIVSPEASFLVWTGALVPALVGAWLCVQKRLSARKRIQNL
jgi:hypothetical protein